MKKSRILGKNVDNKKKVFIPDYIRSTHMHVIGSTGTGKSKFLEWMIREDIRGGEGVCLIDPHGYLYDDLVNWMASEPIFFEYKKIVLFNPANDDYFLGFNPFSSHRSIDISHKVDTMVNACAKAWGAQDMDATPLLKKCLRCIFHALAETDLTLVEAFYFISLSEDAVNLRKYLTAKIKDPIIREVWRSFEALSSREYNEQFSSSANRIIEFLSSERIRRILGQSKNTIDFKEMMDEGYIVLVNLSSGKKLSKDNARLLGTLMVNDLFLSASERKRVQGKPPKPFYLYIDECSQFLNEDIGRILDECRKFGLHLVLAHQHLAQLKKAGEDIYSSVMTDAKTKIIFGGLTPDDAEILAKQIYMGEFDIDEVKNKIYSRKVVDYRLRWFRSVSETEAHSDTDSESTGSSSGGGSGRGSSVATPQTGLFDENGTVINTTNEFVNSTSSSSSSFGTAHTDSYSKTESKSEGLEPVMGEELSSKQFRELAEQLYRAMAIMVNQPQAHCLVKMPGKKVKTVVVERIHEGSAMLHPNEDLILKYQLENFEKYKNKFISLKAEVDKSIESRHRKLLLEAQKLKELEKKKKQGKAEDFRE